MKRLFETFRYYSRKFASYHLFTYASSASFFIITALLPLIMLSLSIVSFTPLAEQDFLDMISEIIPTYFMPILRTITKDITGSGITALSISVVAIIWSASKSVLGLMEGLNAIANVEDYRNYFLKRAVCIVYMLLLIVGLILTLSLRVFGMLILAELQTVAPHLAKAFETLLGFRGLTLIVVLTVIFLIIYTAFPNKKMRVLLQFPGAVFSAMVWIGFSELFSFYVETFPSFSMVYGSIGVVILAMIWLYFCISIVFIGAVLNQLYPSIFWRVYVVMKHRRIQRIQAFNEKHKRSKAVGQETKSSISIEKWDDEQSDISDTVDFSTDESDSES